eukprot:365130-Chlamydomonas_euryale.AAC.19
MGWTVRAHISAPRLREGQAFREVRALDLLNPWEPFGAQPCDDCGGSWVPLYLFIQHFKAPAKPPCTGALQQCRSGIEGCVSSQSFTERAGGSSWYLQLLRTSTV